MGRTGGVVAALALLVLGACGGAETPGSAADAAAPAAPTTAIGTVEATNYPLAYVVERLAGPLLEVHFRAAGAPDPAYWRPTADQVVAMQEADLIVVNGAGYEGWLKDVSLPTSRLVDTTAGMRERLIAIESAVTHSHGTEGAHQHTGTAFTTWLDPTLLIEQAHAVAAALERTWPEQADLFADHLAALVADLEKLDADQAAATVGAAERPVVFSHPVYQYLAKRYELEGHSVHWEPDESPGAKQWSELEHLRDHAKPEWMIWEAEPQAEIAARLEEAGIRSVVVDPCATPPADGDLIDVLRRNAAALREVYATAM